MANIQHNIEYLSNTMKGTFHNQEALHNFNAPYNSIDQLNGKKVWIDASNSTIPHALQHTGYEITPMQKEVTNDKRELYLQNFQKNDELEGNYDTCSSQHKYGLKNNTDSNGYNVEDDALQETNEKNEQNLTDNQNVDTSAVEVSYEQYEEQHHKGEYDNNKEEDIHDMTQYSQQEYDISNVIASNEPAQ